MVPVVFVLLDIQFYCGFGRRKFLVYNFDAVSFLAGLSFEIFPELQLIVATSVAKWYFTKNKLTIGSWTVLGSIIDVCWYHAGTAAYGSLLLAIIQLIRAILTKLQKEAAKADSKIAKCILCCCQCFFCCLESCMKFINKNAYIQTAICKYSGSCLSCVFHPAVVH